MLQFLFILSILSAVYGFTQLIQTTNCGGNGNNMNNTCSPSFCSRVSNTNCAVASVATNVQGIFQALSCRTCTQSTVNKCTQTYLNKNLKTSGGLVSVYCNDNYLVVIGTNVPNHADGLNQIPRPPGFHDSSGGGADYASGCVYRTYAQTLIAWSMVLNPQMLSNASLQNNKGAFTGKTTAALPGIYLPGAGPMALSVSGLEIFPIFNNLGAPSQSACELDKCNAHSAGDYHYHGDPFSNKTGECMYSLADYDSTTAHPPVIGWSFDGYDIYGRHLSTSAVGYSVALDFCGGHSHNDSSGNPLGYHYHTQVVLLYTTVNNVQEPYFAYVPGPFYCWRGNISVTKFFDNVGPLNAQRGDYTSLQPCCTTRAYYLASGYSFNGVTLSTSSPTTKPTPSPSFRPTGKPSASPTTIPTSRPTPVPSIKPSSLPTLVSSAPSISVRPSSLPTFMPTLMPSGLPSFSPSAMPTIRPSISPSVMPTILPTAIPTTPPPSSNPSNLPTRVPTPIPSFSPTSLPTFPPPTSCPTTARPTAMPTFIPTSTPSLSPSTKFAEQASVSVSQFIATSATASQFLSDSTAVKDFIDTVKDVVGDDKVVTLNGVTDSIINRRLGEIVESRMFGDIDGDSRILANGITISYTVTDFIFSEANAEAAAAASQSAISIALSSSVQSGAFSSSLQSSSSLILKTASVTLPPSVTILPPMVVVTSAPSKAPTGSSSKSSTVIIAAVVGGGGGLLLIVILAFCFTRASKKSDPVPSAPPSGIELTAPHHYAPVTPKDTNYL